MIDYSFDRFQAYKLRNRIHSFWYRKGYTNVEVYVRPVPWGNHTLYEIRSNIDVTKWVP